MYPGSIFELIDQSAIPSIPKSVTVDRAPTFVQAFGSDKGPEDWRLVKGDEFFELYGTDLSKAYKKYGQPLIQAAAIINAGGKLYAKRVVPTDATLANIILGARVVAKDSNVKIELVTGSISDCHDISSIKTEVANPSFSFDNDYTMEQITVSSDSNIDATGISLSTDAVTGVSGGSMKVSLSGSLTYGGQTSTTLSAEADAEYDAWTEGDGSTSTSNVTIKHIVAQVKLEGKGLVDIYRGGLTATMTMGSEGKPEFSDIKLAENGVCTKWTALGVSTVSTADEIATVLNGTITEGTFVFPLFVIADTGRGSSNKSFVISHDVTSSKSMQKAVYAIKVYDGDTDYSSIQFVLDPTATNGTTNISFADMVNENSTQIIAYQCEDSILDFIDVVDTLRKSSNIDDTNALTGGIDYLFGKNKVGKDMSSFEVTVSGSNSLFSTPVVLKNGLAGDLTKLGNSKTGWNAYEAFRGDDNYSIFDLDNVKMDIIGDANYDTATKNAILRLVNFREDCAFLRDMGITGLKTKEEVVNAVSNVPNSKFQQVYNQYFDIRDPYSKRQVTVSIVYDIVRRLVTHLVDKAHAPMAGLKYGFVCDSAIEGTVSYIPTIHPGLADNGHNYHSSDAINEKAELEDARINYASYINGQLVVETEYNNQVAFSQFSYGNNILGIQKIIKDIRSACPSTRYSWLDGQDLDNYKNDVNKILEQYQDKYQSLTFEYIEDTTYVSNKIFYGAIKVQFRNFVQTEYFKVIALPS